MAYLKAQEEIKEKLKQEVRERLTAVKQVKIEHFSSHESVEGYTGSGEIEHAFGCDRLLKVETMFSKVQMGFDPNKNKSFLTMNLKTSRYDTIDSQYQKEIKEEQMKPVNRNGFQNRVYASKKKTGAAVLIEKSDTRPWSEATIMPHYRKGNTESMEKAMPFFSRKEEKTKRLKNKHTQSKLQKDIQENIKKGKYKDNNILRKKQRELIYEDNLLLHFIQLKEAESRYFFRKLNFAYDTQKNEMFDYYKNRKASAKGKTEVVKEQPLEDGEKDD